MFTRRLPNGERIKVKSISARPFRRSVFDRISDHEKQQRELFRILPTEVIQTIIQNYNAKI